MFSVLFVKVHRVSLIFNNSSVVINSVSRMTRTMKVWYELEDLLPQFRFVETGRDVPNLTTVAVMSAVAKAENGGNRNGVVGLKPNVNVNGNGKHVAEQVQGNQC